MSTITAVSDSSHHLRIMLKLTSLPEIACYESNCYAGDKGSDGSTALPACSFCNNAV
jgi:hypothetical protein